MRLGALVALSAGVHLVVQRVVLLLLPPVRELAPVLVLAPVRICLYEILGFPLRALLLLVFEDVRFPPEVLPVVRIHTRVPRMRGVRVGAPHRLEMEHVKVRVLLELVQQVHCHFFFRVRKCTHVAVVTRLHLAWVRLTEFHLILFRVIEFLYAIVRARAGVAQGTLVVRLRRDHVRTDLGGVAAQVTSAVFLRFVVEEALLRIVLVRNLTLLCLEIV